MVALGELAGLATAICWSFTSILFSIAGRRVGSPVVNRSRLLFATVFLMGAHIVTQGSAIPVDAEPFRWRWLALSGLLGLVLGDAALFQAFVLIGPRLSMLMMSLVPTMSVVLGWTIFGETVSLGEATGMALAIVGVIFVVTERSADPVQTSRSNYRLGLALGVVGALGQATNLATAKFGLAGGFPTISATLIRILVAVTIMWAYAAYRQNVGPTIESWKDRRALGAILGGTMVGPFIGVWLSMFAVQNAPLGIASTLMALPPVLLIPLERLFQGKTVTRRATIGTLVAFAGVARIFVAG